MSILVVDDESRMRKLIKDFLQKNEYEVIEAVNGEDALEVYNQNKDKINLIILDVMMPKQDGWSVLRKIRQSSRSSSNNANSKRRRTRRIIWI